MKHPIENINELNINDSVLLETKVLIDSVEMSLCYIEGYVSQKLSNRRLVFENCRRVVFLINHGFDCPNSLLMATEEQSIENYRKIRFETNATAGVIEIECKSAYMTADN